MRHDPTNRARHRVRAFAALAIGVSALTLLGCEALDPPARAAPVTYAYAHPVAPATYVWIADRTPVTVESAAPAPIVEPPPEAPPAPTAAVDPAPPPVALAVTPLPTRAVITTGVSECDAYVAHVEACTARRLEGRAIELQTMHDVLDAARRSFRVSADQGRATALADECAASLRTYLGTAACDER